MDIFLTLFFKLIPLYSIIGLGFVAGKYLKVQKESIATIVIYIFVPIIVFNGTATTPITISTLSLPILFYVLCSLMCLLFYFLGGFIWKDNTRNILALASGTGNTGYFGLPVVAALFPPQSLGLAILIIMGFQLFENSLGFFIAAKGQHTVREAILKVIKLPTLYAFFLGILINVSGIHLGQTYTDMLTNFRGSFTILGMMIIGLGLASIRNYAFDYIFLTVLFLAKFLVWPLMVLTVIMLDNFLFKLYSTSIHNVMLLMAIVPLAANTVVIATELKVQPEKAAVTVLLSTLFALFYIPLVALFFF